MESRLKYITTKTYTYTPNTILASIFSFRLISRATFKVGSHFPERYSLIREGLTFNNDIEIRLNDESGTPIGADNYTIKLNPSVTNATTNLTTDKCTFEIEFTDTFCNNLNTNNKIYVTYSATLNGNAIIGTSTEANNNNTTKITYGLSLRHI